jgi:hypothetical protein
MDITEQLYHQISTQEQKEVILVIFVTNSYCELLID